MDAPQQEQKENEDPTSDQQSWEEVRLLRSSHEEELRSAKEKQAEAEAKQTEADSSLKKFWARIWDNKSVKYLRDFGPIPDFENIKPKYLELSHQLEVICSELARSDVIPAIDNLSTCPRYWEIASPGVEPWMREFLVGNKAYRMRRWILQRVFLPYILGSVSKPMLLGLDREAEILLTRLQENMQSRMCQCKISFPFSFFGQFTYRVRVP